MRKIILTILFLFTISSIVFADTESSPFSYTAETSDKKYIFVMLTPNCDYCWGSDKYKQSGMYLNNGSTTPLWTVDWQRTVFLPSDGKHVVRLGKWSRYSATYQEEAFSFVDEGKILTTYKTTDLVDFPWLLPHSSSHYGLLYTKYAPKHGGDAVGMKVNESEEYTLNDGVTIDDENSTILIPTVHNDKFLFDLKTGKVISAERTSRNTAIWLFSFIGFVYLLYFFTVRKSNLKKLILIGCNFAMGFLLAISVFFIPIISVSIHQTVRSVEDGYMPFLAFCYLSIQTFPRYLLTNLNLISPPESSQLILGFRETLVWFFAFWIPCILLFGVLTHFFTTSLNKFHKSTN